MHRRDVALQVLVDEEEVRELRVALRDEHEPRRRDREQNEQAASRGAGAARARRRAAPARRRSAPRPAARSPIRPLREHGERHRRPRDEHPAPRARASWLGMLRDQQRRRGRRRAQRETPMSSELKWLPRFHAGVASRTSAASAGRTRGPNQRRAATSVASDAERRRSAPSTAAPASRRCRTPRRRAPSSSTAAAASRST